MKQFKSLFLFLFILYLVLCPALFFLGPLAAQNTAVFPAAVPTRAQFGVAANQAATTLTVGIGATDTTLNVSSTGGFKAGSFVAIDSEIVRVCAIPDGTHLTIGFSSCPNVDGRGTDTANGGGAAASHLANAPAQARIVAWPINQAAAEIIATDTKLHTDLINVRDFGAVGDGTTHPLSGSFGTLAAAQVVYPFVTTLAEEIDNAATQAAVNAAKAISGSRIRFPAGIFLFNTGVSIPVTPGSLILEGVGWHDTPPGGTTLRATAAIALFTPVNGGNENTIRDMTLDGNSVGTYGWYGAYGTRTLIYNMQIFGFTNDGAYFGQGLNRIDWSYIYHCGEGVLFYSDGTI